MFNINYGKYSFYRCIINYQSDEKGILDVLEIRIFYKKFLTNFSLNFSVCYFQGFSKSLRRKEKMEKVQYIIKVYNPVWTNCQ